MTNIAISYPCIPFNSVMTSDYAEYSDATSLLNTVAGPRYTRSIGSGSSSFRYYYYDLGSDYISKGATADHVIIARADIGKAGVPVGSVSVYRSTDGASWGAAGITTAQSFIGPRSHDWLETGPETAEYRYWRVGVGASSGATPSIQLSKIYLGKFFTFTVSPEFEIERLTAGETSWYTDSGAAKLCRADEPVYRFTMTWKLVTDAILKSFEDKILRYAAENPVFLYSTVHHDALDNQRLVHCQIESAEARRMGGIANCWELRVVFVELIG